jgi:hypothetical protein
VSSFGPVTDRLLISKKRFLSASAAEKAVVPLGVFISGDEDVAEVREHLTFFTVLLTNVFPQFDKIVDLIQKKGFAAKSDYKNYSNMYGSPSYECRNS